MAKTNNKPFKKGKSNNTKGADSTSYKNTSPAGESFSEFFNSRPQEIRDSCTLAFNRPLGNTFWPLPRTAYSSGVANPAYMGHVEPGLMTIDLRFGPGYSNGPTSPVNIAANAIYSYVRHVNSGAKNYDPADLMLYLMSLDTVYVWYEQLVRAYGLCRTYSAYNRYKPKMLVQALGFDFDDLINNLPLFRNQINWFVDKIGSLCVPAMKYFGWHRKIFKNVYADAVDPRAQLYAMRPDGLYFYNETDPEVHAGYLKYYPWGTWPGSSTSPTQYLGLNNIQSICDKFTEYLMGSEDIGVMSGDILKAYGDNIFHLDYIDEDYKAEFYYDETMLNMIANSEVIPLDPNQGADILQDTNIGAGGIIYKPTINALYRTYPYFDTDAPRILNMYHGLTDPDSVCMATRLLPATYGINSSSEGPAIVHGTEIPTSYKIWSFRPAADGRSVTNVPDTIGFMTYHVYTPSVGAINILPLFDALTAFDYAPKVNFVLTDGDNNLVTNAKQNYTIMETSDYDILGCDALSNIHQTAIISLWDVPQMGTSRSIG